MTSTLVRKVNVPLHYHHFVNMYGRPHTHPYMPVYPTFTRNMGACLAAHWDLRRLYAYLHEYMTHDLLPNTRTSPNPLCFPTFLPRVRVTGTRFSYIIPLPSTQPAGCSCEWETPTAVGEYASISPRFFTLFCRRELQNHLYMPTFLQ